MDASVTIAKGYRTGRLLHKLRQPDAGLFVARLLPFFVPANVASLVANFLTVTVSEPRHAGHDNSRLGWIEQPIYQSGLVFANLRRLIAIRGLSLNKTRILV
jgi:hypothetical protein